MDDELELHEYKLRPRNKINNNERHVHNTPTTSLKTNTEKNCFETLQIQKNGGGLTKSLCENAIVPNIEETAV